MSGIVGGVGAKSGIINNTFHALSGASGVTVVKKGGVNLDYEEGTWTPNMIGSDASGGAGSWAMGGQEGDYIKIGKTVIINMYGYVSNKGGYAGDLRVFGLPYANTGFGNATTLSIGAWCTATTEGISAMIPGGGNSYILFKRGESLETAIPWSEVLTGHSTSITGWYHLA